MSEKTKDPAELAGLPAGQAGRDGTAVADVKSRNKYMNADEYSNEELEALSKLYSQSFKDVKEGEIIKGKIVSIQGDNVILDVGFKSEGTIPKSEFTAGDEIKIGEEVEIVIESVEDAGR